MKRSDIMIDVKILKTLTNITEWMAMDADIQNNECQIEVCNQSFSPATVYTTDVENYAS